MVLIKRQREEIKEAIGSLDKANIGLGPKAFLIKVLLKSRQGRVRKLQYSLIAIGFLLLSKALT